MWSKFFFNQFFSRLCWQKKQWLNDYYYNYILYFEYLKFKGSDILSKRKNISFFSIKTLREIFYSFQHDKDSILRKNYSPSTTNAGLKTFNMSNNFAKKIPK